MIFKREQHDGLYAVINRQGKEKIVFTNGQFETTDPEQCKTLIEMGYAYDGELPGEKQPAAKEEKKHHNHNKAR